MLCGVDHNSIITNDDEAVKCRHSVYHVQEYGNKDVKHCTMKHHFSAAQCCFSVCVGLYNATLTGFI